MKREKNIKTWQTWITNFCKRPCKTIFLLFRIFRSCSIFNVSLNQCSCNQTPKLQKFIFVSGTCFCVSLQWYLAWKFKGPFATQNSSVKSNLIPISSRFIYSAINERITSWENNKQTQRQTDILKPISNTYNAKEHFFQNKNHSIFFFSCLLKRSILDGERNPDEC